jgi:hypothetical protein
MPLRPSVIRDQDRIDVRLTSEADYRIPFTFIEALNEGTLFDLQRRLSWKQRGSADYFRSSTGRPTTLLALASFKDLVMRNRRRKRRLVG